MKCCAFDRWCKDCTGHTQACLTWLYPGVCVVSVWHCLPLDLGLALCVAVPVALCIEHCDLDAFPAEGQPNLSETTRKHNHNTGHRFDKRMHCHVILRAICARACVAMLWHD